MKNSKNPEVHDSLLLYECVDEMVHDVWFVCGTKEIELLEKILINLVTYKEPIAVLNAALDVKKVYDHYLSSCRLNEKIDRLKIELCLMQQTWK